MLNWWATSENNGSPNSSFVIKCDWSSVALEPSTAPWAEAGNSIVVTPRMEFSVASHAGSPFFLLQPHEPAPCPHPHELVFGRQPQGAGAAGNDHHDEVIIGSSISALTPPKTRNISRKPSAVPRRP